MIPHDIIYFRALALLLDYGSWEGICIRRHIEKAHGLGLFLMIGMTVECAVFSTPEIQSV